MLPIPCVVADPVLIVASLRARSTSMLSRTSPPSTAATLLTGRSGGAGPIRPGRPFWSA